MKTLEKINLFERHKADYAATKKPALVNLDKAVYLSITGQGEPGGEGFTDKIGALYGVAYTIKMTRKFAGQQDYAVGKLEAQWWCGEDEGNFARFPKAQWCWKLLIRTPDFISESERENAIGTLVSKGKSPAVREVRLESLAEGWCVQMLHVGPYEDEAETIAAMQELAAKNGWQFCGRHHEIYLSDPHRVAPEKLKTILRHPVAKSPP